MVQIRGLDHEDLLPLSRLEVSIALLGWFVPREASTDSHGGIPFLSEFDSIMSQLGLSLSSLSSLSDSLSLSLSPSLPHTQIHTLSLSLSIGRFAGAAMRWDAANSRPAFRAVCRPYIYRHVCMYI